MNPIEDIDAMQAKITLALDAIPVPAGPSALRRRRLSGVGPSLVVAAVGALVVALVALSLGQSERAAHPGASVAVTAVSTPNVDRTTAPDALVSTRARIAVVRTVLFVQPEVPDWHRTSAMEVRVVDAAGNVISSAPIRNAAPGEPRICGDPSIVPPLVAALQLPADVVDDFTRTDGPRSYHVELRELAAWHTIQLDRWLQGVSAPCTS